MKTDRLTLVVAGLLVSGVIAACTDYAKKNDLAALRAEYVATHDTLIVLWAWAAKAVCTLQRGVHPTRSDSIVIRRCLPGTGTLNARLQPSAMDTVPLPPWPPPGPR